MSSMNTPADRNLSNKNSEIENELEDCTDDKACVYETVISGRYIKEEPCDIEDRPGSISKYVNIKNENIDDLTLVVQETISTTNTKEEYNYNFCEECGQEYDLYCLNCPMLIRIFDSNKPNSVDKRVRRTLPKNFIDIRETPSDVGIVALRVVPKGIVFGPFGGLDSIKGDSASKWKLKNKEVAYIKDPTRLNWMQYVRRANECSQGNLIPFQYEDGLYYHSKCCISVGDELLVYWESDNEKYTNQDSYLEPPVCDRLDNTYACTFCCVGYKSINYLTAHNSTCPEKRNKKDFCKEIIQCTFCKIYLDEKEYLIYHNNRCYGNNTMKYIVAPHSPEDTEKLEVKDKYKCSMCEYSTLRRENFRQHQLTHADLRIHKCPECSYRARTKQCLQRHVRTHVNTNRKRFQCEHCGERFARSDIFAMHQKKEHSVSTYKCDKCVFETTNARVLRRHLATHKDAKPYRCITCDKQLKSKRSLLAHVRMYHSEKREYKCPKCDYKTVNPKHINRHMLNKHANVERFKCTRCTFKTRYKSTLESHLQFHEDVKSIKCEHCDMEFWNTQSLVRHEKEVHAIAEKTYRCCKCDYRTRRKSDFNQHLRAHDGAKSFKCGTCSQMFKEKSTLVKHARNIHSKSENRAYKCPQCTFETNYKTSFKYHVNAHNKSELFQCSKCDFNTHHKGTFTAHRFLHKGTKKYGCQVCSFRTNDEHALDEHLKTHELVKRSEDDKHENKIFNGQERAKSLDCPTCGKTFNYKGYLLKHINRFHASKILTCLLIPEPPLP